MKKNIRLCFILVMSVYTDAQAQENKITVTLTAENKILIPPKEKGFKYALPFKMDFDFSFKDKKIIFYSKAEEATKIDEVVFGSQDLGHKKIDGVNKFIIEIKSDSTIALKDAQKKLTQGEFFFKINDSDFSSEVGVGNTKKPNFPMESNGNKAVYQPGFMIDDALKIKALLKDPNTNLVDTILEYYGISITNLDSNHFLKNKFESLIDKAAAQGTDKKNLSSIASSVGGYNVAILADGVAKFLIKRAKEELAIAFFDKFRTDLKRYPDISTLFPSTYDILEGIDDNIYDFSNFTMNLKAAFLVDLKQLDEHLPGILDNHKDFFERSEALGWGIALKMGCYVSKELRHNAHPGDILDGFDLRMFDEVPDTSTIKNVMTDLKGSIQLLQLLSESCRESDTTTKRYWVDMDKIRVLVNDPETLQIYMGLLLQRAKQKYNEVNFSSTTLYKLLNDAMVVEKFSKDYPAYKSYLLSLGNKMQELSNMIRDSKQPASDSLKVEQYAKFFSSSVGLMEYCVQANKLPYLNTLKDMGKKIAPYFAIVHEVADLTASINRKKYVEAVNHAVVIYTKVVHRPMLKIDSAKVSSVTKLMQYGAFMANMVNANSSDDVTTAVEAAALPVGSSSIKRKTKFNMALNAYIGGFYGREKIKGVEDNAKWNTWGITAPIGVSVNFGNRFLLFPTKHAFSSSLFLSLVDIGALAAFRLSNDSAKQVPDIQLKNILSPGVFYSMGFPSVPLSLNVGWQMGSLLRSVNLPANSYGTTYSRFSVSLCVDIPLLNFVTKRKEDN